LRRTEAAAPGGLDPDEIARDEVARRVRRQLRAVQQVPPRRARRAASGALGRMASPLAEDRQPAGSERPQRAHDTVAAAKATPAAGSGPEGIPLDPQRV